MQRHRDCWEIIHRSYSSIKSPLTGTSLVAQWLRIRLPMQGTWVRALVREGPTCCGAAKPVCHNSWACTLEPMSHNYWVHVLQLLKPACLEPVLCHHNEKPAHCNEDPTQPKKKSPLTVVSGGMPGVASLPNLWWSDFRYTSQFSFLDLVFVNSLTI